MPESLDARARSVFDQVIDRAGADRAALIQQTCEGDPALRARVEVLLASAEKDDRFLSDPTLNAVDLPVQHVSGEQPGARIGPYTLVELIGEGGFGSVFLARQTAPVQRDVALKIIKAGMDTRQVIARFEAERQALALMDHPNIARVLEAGATGSGRPYFVMELVRGDPVTRFCDRELLAVPERLDLFRKICAAVQHAHQKGIIHRDLKPSNILVTNADGAVLPKVIDFGVAKATAARLTDQTLTGLHQLVGTPEYMSPEQTESSGMDIDTRSDVYSLGVLLYELLTGTTPFDRKRLAGSGIDGMRRILRDEEPMRPSLRLQSAAASSADVRPLSGPNANDSSVIEIATRRRTEPALLTRALRRDLDWIVLKCLEKERARRYETASALADDIGRYLADQPVLATPPRAGYRLQKFVRRNRGAVIAGVAVSSALVLGTIGTTIGLVWAVNEERRAEDQRMIATREADQARAVNDFMRQVLTSVDPQNGGAEVRLRDVLADASASASQRFADHPLLEAQVRDLLGNVYNSLSLWPEAKSEHRRALALVREFAGPDDPRALRAAYLFAGAALSMNETSEAEMALADSLPRMEAVLGSDDLTTLDARRGLALVHLQRGRLDEAERILLELRAHPRLAEDDHMQIRILHSLIVLQNSRPLIDDRAEGLAFSANAVQLGRERVERSLRVYGPLSAVTLQAQVGLAQLSFAHEEFDAAVEICRSVLANSSERLGECHAIRTTAMLELAAALGRKGEAGEPAELYLRGIRCARQRAPDGGIVLIGMLSDGLHYLDRAGRAVEGEALARELNAELLKFGGGHGDMSFSSEMCIAHFVSMAGRLEEAEALFQPLLAREAFVSDSAALARLLRCYACHQMRRGSFERAEQCLERAVALRGDVREGTWNDMPDDLIVAFIQLYQAWQRPEKVREYERLREVTFGIPPRRSED
jgi:serine/threonine protein kinase/tetratricopeptide (TPR) repeat protein